MNDPCHRGNALKLASNEINLSKLKNIQHKNICKIFGGFIDVNNDGENRKIIGAVFMQHYEGENLTEERQWPEQRCRKLLRTMLKALSVLHSKNIVHRDIKPANIILQPDGRCILVDLGACKLLGKFYYLVACQLPLTLLFRLHYGFANKIWDAGVYCA